METLKTSTSASTITDAVTIVIPCLNEARSLGQSIFTHAVSMDELRQEIRDAVCCHFDCGVAPVTIRLCGVHDEVINT